MIALVGFNGKFRRFKKRHLGTVIAHDKRNGLSEVAIGWIPDQTGAGISFGADEHVTKDKRLRAKIKDGYQANEKRPLS
jgi:hypothetical protein